MNYLSGFSEYRRENQNNSIFKTAMSSEADWCIHLYGKSPVTGRIVGNDVYEVTIDCKETGEFTIKKLFVKFLYPVEQNEIITKLIKKIDKKVKKLNLEPTENFRERYFIKNKTLYPLMKEREVVFFTLLEGDIIRGLIQDFSMFDITVGLKGGVPLTFLRHGIYDAKNKAGRCFLKSFQQEAQDWKKSDLYILKNQE
ncbi:hypothetical protein SAMN02746065_10880 [Desulfocicer vacuolatum DSM 3385]|uniref:Uncharacterized protein n=1 Tax=Desulfocicer vacuolatum DSM 3385 TaxID=1121400 RepID=A0A1W2BGR9_9BACT|nr:hypothetical protein [Desulfocicer vacuolatum]SMC72046.1 hypothetical protein SAMN02746065_10880 [Desulfocicer vacuolatum DSM 3385]